LRSDLAECERKERCDPRKEVGSGDPVHLLVLNAAERVFHIDAQLDKWGELGTTEYLLRNVVIASGTRSFFVVANMD
jgi:hypothetical protein